MGMTSTNFKFFKFIELAGSQNLRLGNPYFWQFKVAAGQCYPCMVDIFGFIVVPLQSKGVLQSD
jgi:hypothetical protein